MSYIGNTPAEKYTSLSKQDLTGDGTVGPYTLDYAVGGNAELEVFVNNVRQEPSSAYSVAGNQLTMTGNVASSDDFYVVFQGKSIGTISPPDGSVTSAKLDTNIAVAGNLDVGTIRSTNGTTAATIDSSGRILQPALPAFRAYGQDASWTDYTAGQIVTFKNASTGDYFNQGGHFSESTYKFICPVDGVYLFGFSLYVMEDDDNGAFTLYRNGTALSNGFKVKAGDDSTIDRTSSATWTLLCSSGDEISVHCQSDLDLYGQFSQFHGHFVG